MPSRCCLRIPRLIHSLIAFVAIVGPSLAQTAPPPSRDTTTSQAGTGKEVACEAAAASFAEGERLRKNKNGASYRAAIEAFHRAASEYHDCNNRQERAEALNRVALIESYLGQTQDPLKHYGEALHICRDAGDQIGEATTLNNIGRLYDSIGNRREALKYLTRALPIWQQLEDKAGQATTLNNIGLVYDNLGEKQQALKYYGQALPLRRQVGDRSGEATTLINIGAAYARLGKKQQALGYYNQALPICQEVGDRVGEAVTLNNIGAAYDDMGQKKEALKFYEQALPIRREVGDRAGEATSLNNIGRIFENEGQVQEALKYLGQALSIWRSLADRPGEAIARNNMGTVYNDLGALVHALNYLHHALSIFQEVEDREGEAMALNNIGAAYDEMEFKDQALKYYGQALTTSRQLGDRADEAVALNNIALVYNTKKEGQEALKYLEQALPIFQSVENQRGEATVLNNIGLVLSNLNRKQEALGYYGKALPIRREVGDRAGEAITLSNLMELLRSDDPQLAIIFGKQSVNILQELRRNLSGLNSEQQKEFAKSHEGTRGTYRQLVSLLISAGRWYEAERIADMLKDEEYFGFIRRGEPVARTEPVALNATDVQPLVALAAEESAMAAKETLSPAEQQRKDYLDGQLKAARLAASQFFDQAGRVRAPRDVQSAKGAARDEQQEAIGLQKDLGANTVAIYTVVADDSFHSLLITPRLMKAWNYQIKKEDLRKKVFAFREALRDPNQDPVPAARELYRILVGDLGQELAAGKTTTILWSLDDVLRYIPMAALNDGHQYLAERFRNVVYSKASSRAGGEFHDWHALAAGVSQAHFGLPPLDNVPKELAGIIRGQNGTGVLPGTMMLDTAFTPAAFRAALHRDYTVVHIASHFVFNPGNDLESFLLLGNGKLTLAELRENSDYSFDGVQLLTLSACDSAAGEGADGREIDGLGFLAEEKGARAILASLWEVDDESTGEFMQQFYRQLSSPGITKAEALQRAELALLHGEVKPPPDGPASFAHPYFWAPFILIGNGH